MSNSIMSIQEIGDLKYLVGGFDKGLVVIRLQEGDTYDKLVTLGDHKHNYHIRKVSEY